MGRLKVTLKITAAVLGVLVSIGLVMFALVWGASYVEDHFGTPWGIVTFSAGIVLIFAVFIHFTYAKEYYEAMGGNKRD
jgi:hypothetical protein